MVIGNRIQLVFLEFLRIKTRVHGECTWRRVRCTLKAFETRTWDDTDTQQLTRVDSVTYSGIGQRILPKAGKIFSELQPEAIQTAASPVERICVFVHGSVRMLPRDSKLGNPVSRNPEVLNKNSDELMKRWMTTMMIMRIQGSPIVPTKRESFFQEHEEYKVRT
ncbi:uncharacterized protein LOC124412537 [Diprion similis]|uniref:uncharacterized protein LOC124412537 n=1 Tax=Diprion similis TaxID=362088 RepID=UPI001EF78AAD|nr:uncharacterized protein LOC124412537 [Diprion similis]